MAAMKIRQCLAVLKRNISLNHKSVQQSRLLQRQCVFVVNQTRNVQTAVCSEGRRNIVIGSCFQRHNYLGAVCVRGISILRSITTTPKELKPTRLLTGRLKKKKTARQKLKDGINAAAFVVGDSIDLHRLRGLIKHEELYEEIPLPDDIKNTMMVTALYRVDEKDRDVFFFSDGRVACWNMKEGERKAILETVLRCTSKPLSIEAILDEEELQPVVFDRITKFANSKIHIKQGLPGEEYDEDLALQKYAFSDAMGQTVILSFCEKKLDAFTDKIEPEMQKLRDGSEAKMIIRDVNRNRGEVFLLRHEINLESDLLDTPDLYWEREDLEVLYKAMVDYYNLRRRILVFNERLDYCSDFLELLSNQHNDDKHVFLEKVIIYLIMIEVVLGGVPFLEHYFPWLFDWGIGEQESESNEDLDSVKSNIVK